jgi:hypothetical protein
MANHSMILRSSLLVAIVILWPVLADCSAQPAEPGQAAESDDVVHFLETPAGWAIEQIPIPLGFAPALQFNGVEDIRFAPGWASSDSPDFWTYKFAWEIDEDPQLDEQRLSQILETYFEGLSQAVSQLGDALQPPAAVFIRDGERYRGRLRIYDAFTTKAWIYLNARVHGQRRGEKHLVIFEFSPQNFDHDVWQKLEQIRIDETAASNHPAGN